MSERLWIPDYSRAIAGCRQWQVAPAGLTEQDGMLYPLVGKDPWPETEDMVAKCERNSAGDHHPPGDGCGCGLWAFHTPLPIVWWKGMLEDSYHVAGVISAWGEILVADDGFRAECARVEAIFDHPAMSDNILPVTKRALASAYDAEIVSPTEYEEFCQRRNFVILDEDF
jgi:hypothetical protein